MVFHLDPVESLQCLRSKESCGVETRLEELSGWYRDNVDQSALSDGTHEADAQAQRTWDKRPKLCSKRAKDRAPDSHIV
jgi:hypothetical protein